MSSRPENVSLAREALAGLADALALSREQYDDMRTAVTEACNNVVQHAYRRDEGPLEMEVLVLDDAIEVIVRDEGVGVSRTVEEGGELEIGFPVMLALAERLQVARNADGGTEVQMRFLAPGVQAAGRRGHRSRDGLPQIVLPELQATARAAFSSGELAGAILPRLVVALAARAHFSAERAFDVQIVGDAIGHAAMALANGAHLEVALGASPRRLDLQIGPLVSGGGGRLLNALRLPLERLVDERRVTTIGPDELVLLRMRDSA